MWKLLKTLIAFCFIEVTSPDLPAQKMIRVLPEEIDSVLTNPGIGFMTFQRFNGDSLNYGLGWTEGKPIVYQQFDGNLENKDYPMTTIAYFRVYWKYLEPEQGKYNWEMIDKALNTAHERHQTLMLRIAPYGSGPAGNDTDVPVWYRKMTGNRNEWLPEGEGWRVDAEDPRYASYFGKLITEFGKRYDGNPDLESVDLSIVGFWGEGRGSSILKAQTRKLLVNAYTNNFKKTALISLLTDEKTEKYIQSQANTGWRVDCLGDMGGFEPHWSHMMDYYPQSIVRFGMQDAWKKAPVSLEVCWVIQEWKNRGWDVDYIIDQSLKWHISSFNAKSSSVPKEWWPNVERWLKKMGYRFVLRNFSYSSSAEPGGKISLQSWWENKGVAPIYKKNYKLAIRLINKKDSAIVVTNADISNWLPGDNIYDNAVSVPKNISTGIYKLQIGIVDDQSKMPGVSLAIKGRENDGWYSIGDIEIK